MDDRVALVVQAGAWDIPDDEIEAHRGALASGLEAGWSLLRRGGAAVDACVAAVAAMEDCPLVNAGLGAVLNADGQVELDAGLMDGATLEAGAVAAVSGVRNPIRLARHLLGGPHVMIVGSGAERYAKRHAPELLCAPDELVTELEQQRLDGLKPGFAFPLAFDRAAPADTVGAVALDAAGHLAAATSTGGTVNKAPGRVGDSPVLGSGFYADDRLGACSATGWGESLMRVCMARSACGLLAHGALGAQEAGEAAVALLGERVGGLGGCIVLAPAGEIGVSFNTARMAVGWTTAAGEQVAVLDRGDRAR